MSIYLLQDDALDCAPGPIDMTHVGDGNPGGFIYQCWMLMLGAVGPRWINNDSFVVEPRKGFEDFVIGNQGVSRECVGTDLLKVLLNRKERLGFDRHRDGAVLIKPATKLHGDQICIALDAGVETVITEKPQVRSREHLFAVQDAIRRNRGSQVYPTFQHSKCAPVAQMREIAEEYGPEEVEELEEGFRQNWLAEEPQEGEGALQASHRVTDPLVPLSDLGSHSQEMAETVGGAPLAEVSDPVAEKRGDYAKKVGFYDYVTWKFMLTNGVCGRGVVTQSEKGQADNIYSVLRLKNDVPLAWQLKRGVDVLLRGKKKSAQINNEDDWEPLLRGFDPIFSDEVNDMYGFSPGGHMAGWLRLMLFNLLGIMGDRLVRMNHPVVGKPGYCPSFAIPVADVNTGSRMAAFVLAVEDMLKDGSKSKRIADIMKR